MITILEVEKLGHHKLAYGLALYLAAEMVTKGVFKWGPNWDMPGIVAMDGEKCAGFAMYEDEKDESHVSIDFVGIDKDYRGGGTTLILLGSRLRDVAKRLGKTQLRFGYHANNPYMQDAARIFRAQPYSMVAVINLEDE